MVVVVVVVGGRPVTETDSQQQQLTARCTAALHLALLLHLSLLHSCTGLHCLALLCTAARLDCNLLESKQLAACSCTAPLQSSVLQQQCTAAEKKKKPNLAELHFANASIHSNRSTV